MIIKDRTGKQICLFERDAKTGEVQFKCERKKTKDLFKLLKMLDVTVVEAGLSVRIGKKQMEVFVGALSDEEYTEFLNRARRLGTVEE